MVAGDRPDRGHPGPILGGLVAGSALGYQWNFYLFAVFALLIAAVPAVRAPAEAHGRSAP